MASSADVWTPRDSVPIVTTDTSIVTDRFTAVAGQVDFTLVQFSYVPNEGSLLIIKNGNMLDPFLDFSETSNTTFRLTTASTAGDKIIAIGFTGSIGATTNRHYLGALAVEPTVNGYGVALSASDEGVTYWNTATKDLWLYNGTAWILAASSSPTSANLVNIADTGGYYVATEVESALAELGATTGAGIIGVLDTAANFIGANVEAVLAELALKPCFSVHKNGTGQTNITGIDIVTWSTEDYDTNNDFAANVHTPTVAGKYHYSIQVSWASVTSGDFLALFLYKNGVVVKKASIGSGNSGDTLSLSVDVDMNGTTDYVDIRAENEVRDTSSISGSSSLTFWTGHKVS